MALFKTKINEPLLKGIQEAIEKAQRDINSVYAERAEVAEGRIRKGQPLPDRTYISNREDAGFEKKISYIYKSLIGNMQNIIEKIQKYKL